MNRPQSGALSRKEESTIRQVSSIQDTFSPAPQFQAKLPVYKKERPQSANPKGRHSNAPVDDLPEPTFKAILNHIVNNKLFRDVEMKVLYVRLCHRYGEEAIEDLWEQLMDELEK